MEKIDKLAKLFEDSVEDISSFHIESKKLYQIAGKLNYKASKTSDEFKAEKLRKIADLVLAASDMLGKF